MAENMASERRRKVVLTAIAMIIKEEIEDSLSSSSDEEVNTIERLRPTLERRKRRCVPRMHNYVEDVMPRWSDGDFKSHFRMTRQTFEYVLGLTAKKLIRNRPGLKMISPEKQLLLAIWRMATPDSYRSICEKFDVSRSTAMVTMRRVTKALVDLARLLIRWPRRSGAEGIWRGFEAISAFPKVIGAIDGTHIHIPAPRINPEAYINRKGYHSVQLQAVCDHKARFTNCLVGHVGSVHDQRVFRLSEMHDFLGSEEKFPDNCHVLGDSAYKLHQNLLVPYRDNGHLSERQKNFNFCHSSARIAIERAFGLLKGRFRSLLHCLTMTRTEHVADFVMACCVLHNVCIMQGDELPTAAVQPEEVENLVDIGGRGNHVFQAAASAKRDLICATLIMRDV